MKRKIKIAQIKWVDSTSWDAWRNLPLSDSELCTIDTVGYVLEETKDRIVISHSISDANHTNGVLAIPKGAIVKKNIIKKSK